MVRSDEELTVNRGYISIAILGAALMVDPCAIAQERPDPAALLAAQREAMATFAFMDGVWRGPATTVRDRIVPGKDPVRFFEMKLRRVGDSGWPEAGAIAPQ